MDYSTYLTGNTKDELDRLENLAGKYRIQSSKLTIEAANKGRVKKYNKFKQLAIQC